MNATQADLKNEVEYALQNKASNNKIILGKIQNKNAKIIEKITGVNVFNRNQVLYDNDIRHMVIEHQNHNVELKRHQVAITIDDIIMIPSIIKNPDYICLGTLNREGPMVRYIKKYHNYTTYIVEVIPKRKNLKIKTMWKVSH